MTDLLQALALVLVVEGLLWAMFPSAMRRAAALAAQSKLGPLRFGGLAFAATGVVAVWLPRG